MRITGGVLRGRIIKCPDGIIRPAMDRMRESVFSILGDLSGKSFLDLFSGSGTIAIEAVSRGASQVELCEKDKIKVNTVLENVSITEKDVGVKIKCHFMPVEYFIKRCKSSFDYMRKDMHTVGLPIRSNGIQDRLSEKIHALHVKACNRCPIHR